MTYQVLRLRLVLPPVVMPLVPSAALEQVAEPLRCLPDWRLGDGDNGLPLVLDAAGMDGISRSVSR
jgi:hypothetical protein